MTATLEQNIAKAKQLIIVRDELYAEYSHTNDGMVWKRVFKVEKDIMLTQKAILTSLRVVVTTRGYATMNPM